MQENNTNNNVQINKEQYKETFFIKRPVLSTVISLFIMLAGILAIRVLPIAQYPDLVPPVVSVQAQYPGATPETQAATVASPLEQQINGVDDMIYMSTTTTASGFININVSFELGTDPDIATINVNNRVQAALNSLPEDVRRYGVTVKKSSTSILQFVTISSTDDFYDSIYLSNYALINIIDNLKRISGVGDAQIIGAKDYAMRIWLDPEKLEFFQLNPTDIMAAVQEQNAQYAAGSLGQMPSPDSLEITWQINAQGRLVSAEEFKNIIIRSDENGGVLRLGDVAEVELGAVTYDFTSYVNNSPMIPISIYLAPGANALETASLVEAEMERLAANFPYGIEYDIPYDTTIFVRISIEEVIKTLAEAMVLVFLVVYLFLQNWRATLIPCIAVPVSIVGTFAGMMLFGFSINTLTLFGLVLAIGIVVDDAIVVLENVERILESEKGITVRQATSKAMHEVTGAVISIVLVLCSVFVPVAFLGGFAGLMYQQFAITIAISVVLSGVVALTLTPSLCVILLKREKHEPNALFRAFNAFFDKVTHGFTAIVRRLIKSSLLTIALFLVVCYATIHLFNIVPTGLVPDEDQGYVLAIIQLPDGSSLSPTDDVTRRVSEQIMHMEGVEDVVSLAGFNLINNSMSSSSAALFIVLEDWKKRAEIGFDLQHFIMQLYMLGLQEENAQVLPFNPPPIMGMSNTGGFTMFIQSVSGDVRELSDVTRDFIAKANERPELSQVSSTFSINSPRLFIELNRENARALGVNVSDVFTTLASTLGTAYINDFNYLGRTFRVMMQAEEEARIHPDDIEKLYVRNADGNMIPITTLITTRVDSGPATLERFNGFTAAGVTGNPATGYSSGQALDALEALAASELPEGYTIAWSGTSYQEKATGGTNFAVFGLSLIMVLLILAAQYERWTLPLSVLSAVPFAVFGAIGVNWLVGLDNGVYTQVAIITLIGLASKNAILIVEFATDLHKNGKSILDSAIEAAHLRFRPIVMTSLAFILGCVPLAISSGAGAASRVTIGLTVIAGMLCATVLAPLFVPYFYTLVMNISAKFSKKEEHTSSEASSNTQENNSDDITGETTNDEI